jgi:hypothetical protein
MATVAVHAQSGGHIGIYSDNPGFSDCSLYETVGVADEIYIVHVLAVEANTAQFRLIHNWTNASLAGVSFGANLHIGDIFAGVTVTYVGCKPLPHLLATLTFIPITATPGCRVLEIVPDPALPSGEIEVVDCDSNVLAANGGRMCINEYLCCEIGPWPEHCERPVAAEATTWSEIKALYR